MHKTTISEEHEPTDDYTQNYDTNSKHTFHISTNFEKDSLASDTVCTTQMDSLHVNPGSRENLSEDTGDISANVSSEEDCSSSRQRVIDSRLNTEEIQTQVKDSQGSNCIQSRKVTSNYTSSYASSAQPVAVDTTVHKELDSKALTKKDDYSRKRKVTVLKKEEPSSFSTNTQTEVDVSRKKAVKDRSKFEKERANEGNNTISQQSGSCVMF